MNIGDIYASIKRCREVIRSNAGDVASMLSDAMDAGPMELVRIETEFRGATGEIEAALKLLGDALEADARQGAEEDRAAEAHEAAMARAEERALRIAESDVPY